ncbi:hypothetical protein BDV32DRAFT_161110 [Aspergillus pseudonomiae]|uniref:Aminoglycoside phosphotransferase domain-containing protein n=1 Tax=Aspergillus pseudonomiae TaxID=1506151 RepID=A0A5N7DGT6_9EURO|nr:uncharacterized protein BDV37DRAFT_293189 [Aspergillus pseudonomiae]KAB8256638.1 hypothetical protein BDV32DRAFT_161110 [Aspergillus pseudonomiae]KAE8405504.1 hypothetical protein BDV37DRAFT_293189 [Aspergillus pseudonomiae]
MDTEALPTSNWKDDDFYHRNPFCRRIRDACIDTKSTIGGIHLIRILSFGDVQWIARVQLEPSTPLTTSLLRAEIDTMDLVRARTNIPIPKVFGYEVNDENIVGSAFILMEFLLGSSAMDAEGGYDSHHGQAQLAERRPFYDEVAEIQVQMTSVRLPKIGSIVRRSESSFDVGPIPRLGGPFVTAAEFLKAWARNAKFPFSDQAIREAMNGGPVEEVLSSIRNFPHYLQTVAHKISATNHGPFPIYHPDFYHSNIILDNDFKILVIVDWEGASTVPWELVEPPLLLSLVPPPMDDPNDYDCTGLHKEEESRRRLYERAEYIKCVLRKEEELNMDQKLSQTLLDPGIQGLAHAMKICLDPGKL